MTVAAVREHLARFGRESDLVEFAESSATVELAAARLGTEPSRIAKTLAFVDPADAQRALLVLVAGDAKVNSGRFKSRFGGKPVMLRPEVLVELTGHPMGGVSPFAIAGNAQLWLDESLRRFDIVYPAGGSAASAVRIEVAALEETTEALGWVEVAVLPDA